MKVRIAGTSGLCDAALIRGGNHGDWQVRISHPSGEDVFAEREAFRQRVTVAWATAAEKQALRQLKFVDDRE